MIRSTIRRVRALARNLLGALLLAATCGGAAHGATLIGVDVTIDWLFPDVGTSIASQTVTVGAGVEISCPGPGALCGPTGWNGIPVRYDLGADTITFTALVSTAHVNASFNGFQYAGLGAGGPWSDALLDTNIGGLTDLQMSFDGSTLLINLQGLSLPADSYYTVTLVSAAVPEPGSYALVLTALGLLGWAARRRAVHVLGRL